MKVLDKIALVLFSIFILIISIVICCMIFGLVDALTIYSVIVKALANETIKNIILGVAIVFILLSLKAIFFGSSNKDPKYSDGILLENDDGKLLITKETLISMTNAVVSGFESVKDSQTKIFLDKENNLSILLNIQTTDNTIIKELSNNLQLRIKEKMKESLDVDIKNIDIRVKNVVADAKENISESK